MGGELLVRSDYYWGKICTIFMPLFNLTNQLNVLLQIRLRGRTDKNQTKFRCCHSIKSFAKMTVNDFASGTVI